jgi:RND superfamily putative drug exporter
MKVILKLRWLVIVLWIAAAAGLMLTAPNMADLVREKGQITVPEGYSSSVANDLAKEIGDGESGSKGLTTVAVFHKDSGLNETDLQEIRDGLNGLKDGGKALGIASIMTHFDVPELEKQMVAESGKTVLALLYVDLGDREAAEVRDGLYEELSAVSADHYLTGGWLIGEDVIQSAQEGLKKTEYITVIFILLILFIVFRSAAAPFVPLLAVGFSYLVSQSIVSYLVEYFDFPLSNFTQIFMVAVLFGIGTDYCILLISRYKEELAHRGDKAEAIVHTYRTAGRTVLFSGLAVLVGFASIGFSTFVLYRSAVAVAVGIVIMLLAIFTLVPAMLSLLGNAMFWPSKGKLEHKQSKLWGSVGSFSLKRPLWALVLLAIIIVPFLTAYKGSISFNSLDEIGDRYNSVKGFNMISDEFGPGQSLPTNVIVKSPIPMDTSEGLAAVENISRELAKVEGVQSVRSATRPTGEVLTDFLVSDQVTTLDDGLGQGGEGLNKIKDGLSEASSSLAGNAPKLEEAVQGGEKLTAGTNQLKTGIGQLSTGLKAIQKGLNDGSMGAKELTAGLQQAKDSAEQLAAASNELLAGYKELGTGIAGLSGGYAAIAAEHAKLAEGLTGITAMFTGMQESYPELKEDPSYQQALTMLGGLQQGASALGGELEKLNAGLSGASAGLTKANAGLEQASGGTAALAAGLDELAKGIAKLQAGIQQAADGQGKIVGQLPAVEQGLNELASGQEQLTSGFASLGDQLGQLTSGLDESVDGLSQVSSGLNSAGEYLQGLSAAPSKEMTGWYIPQEAIENEDFQKALDVYMSVDRETAQFDVIFESNPYAQETMKEIDGLEAAVARALQGTPYNGGEVAIGGVTSMNHDLDSISQGDYSRTVILMLIGITIILIVLFRSLIIPAYIVLSLIVTFYTSVAMTEVVFVRIMGLSGISWAVPFFGFVMLVALGVDYSIFLMDRFKEYRHLSPKQAILEAMKSMGGVIMSAAVILGGTFAAMLPSGVMSLLQIATLVLCGLFLYALVILPLFIPVMVRTFGEANWWPFIKRNEDQSGIGM